MLRLLRLLTTLLILGGCAGLARNPVPLADGARATVPGMPDVRAWAGAPSEAMARDFALSFEQERARTFVRRADGRIVYPQLALSGGGPNGAFSAGFLKGWTDSGQRPVFKIVTGVSTGAMIAPFAFLGSSYDDRIEHFYTTTATRDVFSMPRSLLLQVLRGEAVADSAPLAALIAGDLDLSLLQRIAAAHAEGRRLYVGTVDLDAQRFVVWNMGLIAQVGTPQALQLFRDVVLASASVPMAVQPVYFEVDVDGRRYDEMHVDGAVGLRVFYNGGLFRTSVVRQRAMAQSTYEDVYIIHNGQLSPQAEHTDRTLRAIGHRTLRALSLGATSGDLFRIYLQTGAEGAGFHWVTMPDGVELRGDELFDPVRMRELFALGYEMARQGPRWETRPPAYERVLGGTP
jgi:predicted patatin/cPLA2 family phospholipase